MARLTIKQVIARAPGAAPVRDPSLLDTTMVIRHLSRRGYKPVFAMQGAEHGRRTAWRGQHLVVMAHANGRAFVLLNAHNKNLRAKLGYGFWNGHEALIGPVVPIRRWKPFVPQFEQLFPWGSDIAALASRLDWTTSSLSAAILGEHIAMYAYPQGHCRPAGFGVVDCKTQNLKELLFEAMSRMRKGGLSPGRGDRRLKPFSSPDTVFKAARETLYVAVRYYVRRDGMPRSLLRMFHDLDQGQD